MINARGDASLSFDTLGCKHAGCVPGRFNCVCCVAGHIRRLAAQFQGMGARTALYAQRGRARGQERHVNPWAGNLQLIYKYSRT